MAAYFLAVNTTASHQEDVFLAENATGN